jgi:hypothetical protein
VWDGRASRRRWNSGVGGIWRCERERSRGRPSIDCAEAAFPSTQRHYSWVRRREGGVRARMEGSTDGVGGGCEISGGARARERDCHGRDRPGTEGAR